MRCSTLGGILTLTLALLCAPLADAQPSTKIFRIGYLELDPAVRESNFEPFRQGLRELGWVEGQNLAFEYGFAGGRHDRLLGLATELVQRKVDVIFTPGSIAAAAAAKQATTTIPIVFVTQADPVLAGLVASLARPGGNVTGLGGGIPASKHLELLREVTPKVTRVAVLWNPANPGHSAAVREELDRAAQELGLQLQHLERRGAAELDSAFAAMTSARAEALLVVADRDFSRQLTQIVALTAQARLPAITSYREFTTMGGLMAYWRDAAPAFRRAATYVDKIFRGAQPADLPVEAPMKFELVINLKTAQALGITIPPHLLVFADEVIK
jgi:putative ABC transport system substrate-binding protein